MHKPARPVPLVHGQTSETATIVAGRADAGLVMLCDHADNVFPPGYGALGLPEDQLRRHIAYDIGAAEVTRQLAAALGVPAVVSHYSRLLIDLNRGNDDPTLIMRLSDGAVVPGNRQVEAAERDRRVALYHEPYHCAVAAVLDACLATGVAPAILSIHSFTESWKGTARPWHAGILWDSDPRLAVPLLDALYAENDLIVGDNQPYVGSGYTLRRHGAERGLAHALIEIRQDLIRDLAGQTAWAVRLGRLMRGLLERPDLRLRFRTAGTPAAQPGTTPPTEVRQMTTIDDKTRTELEAAAYRRLIEHLRQRADVQNIDLMTLAGFCRNCLANWFQEAATTKGLTLTKEQARELIYGMPYRDWQAKHQRDATPEQQAAFAKSQPHEH